MNKLAAFNDEIAEAHAELRDTAEQHLPATPFEAISIVSLSKGDHGQHVVCRPEADWGDIADRLEAAARFIRGSTQ